MNIQIANWSKLTSSECREILSRPVQSRNQELTQKVSQIIQKVKAEGDSALLAFTKEFDRVSISELKVSLEEIDAAYRELSSSVIRALKESIRRVSQFHQNQTPKPIRVETSTGVICERLYLPISRVGLYVPGGTAPLPSTVIMLGVPSRIAGCETRILVTPPRMDQSIDPAILVAADLLGIQEIYKAGGAQAIAAMAYGTASIPKVDKIFGPGNSWVTEAKLQVSQDPWGAVGDLPAGPSEVMVIADRNANPVFVAADLLSQAEHGRDSQVILLSCSRDFIERVKTELNYQIQKLPRKEIIQESLSKSVLIEVTDLEEAFEICNDYAPEHLIIQTDQPRNWVKSVRNAGSVFLGPWTPESMGDYASGTNHVLPTYGFARALSGLGTESFMKSTTFQELTFEGLQELGPVVETLAKTEHLDAHSNAVRVRLQTELL